MSGRVMIRLLSGNVSKNEPKAKLCTSDLLQIVELGQKQLQNHVVVAGLCVGCVCVKKISSF